MYVRIRAYLDIMYNSWPFKYLYYFIVLSFQLLSFVSFIQTILEEGEFEPNHSGARGNTLIHSDSTKYV